MKELTERAGRRISYILGAVFFFGTTWGSYARWANYEYRTFDLAFYVQGLWQLLHGRFDVSLLGVPLLGNHVEPIVFLLAPLFSLGQHPLILVAAQNAALAAMAPIAFRIARRLDLEPLAATAMSAAILIIPATGYIAVHEFHPEAFSAPFLLLMFEARLARALRRYWFSFVCVLACKENLALLLIAYCVVNLVANRAEKFSARKTWYMWPLVAAGVWFVLCTFAITPALNRGNVDYLVLYNRLGTSPGDILRNFVFRPQLALESLHQSLAHGNLLWVLLLCFLGLPLLRPRWLLMAAPILLQHLLSWRPSEWTIYFHYAAPLLPLFWIAATDAIATTPFFASTIRRQSGVLGVLLACLAGQAFIGPAGEVVRECVSYFGNRSERDRKNELITQIPADATVVAPLPYLSHLATREHVYSLHFILKGLKTLSHERYQPPLPTDFVLIDRNDSATFDASAGYYHPAMKTKDGQVIPSSEELLEQFLGGADWDKISSGNLTLLRRRTAEKK